MTLLVVIFTALLGLLVYFRQKEREPVRQRYLDNGIDLIVDNISAAWQLFQQNWARCLLLLKTYQDLKNDTPPAMYKKPFFKADPNAL
jgi:hypothetical protein